MSTCFRLGEAVIEPPRNRISIHGQIHRVRPREMEVLLYLVKRGTQVASRQALLEQVWAETAVNDEVLTLAISRLRAALSDNPRQPRLIETIPKKGYRLMLPVQTCPPRPIRSRPAFLKSARFWVAALALLLALMTALFTIVRIEYERVGPVPPPPSAIEEAPPAR